jgi:hypoxanthine-DNA glycosylase
MSARKPSAATLRLQGLAPVFDRQTRILILGSFPSPASLRAQQYYGHPHNQFWKLLGAIFAQPLPEMPYAERLACVRAQGLGIWDVYRACIRPGALDADLRAGEANDFSGLVAAAPRLERVCFNGRLAARFAPRLMDLGLPGCVLPSSSPAYTLAFAEKLARWQAALAPLRAQSRTQTGV